MAKLARDFEVGRVHGLRRRLAAHRRQDLGQLEVQVGPKLVPQPVSGHAQRSPVDAGALQRVRKALERLGEGQAWLAQVAAVGALARLGQRLGLRLGAHRRVA